MAALSIRDLNERVRERLRIRAAANGRSMEAEVRAILEDAVSEPEDKEDLVTSLVHGFSELGGVDLDVPTRTEPARAADFSA